MCLECGYFDIKIIPTESSLILKCKNCDHKEIAMEKEDKKQLRCNDGL